MATKYVYDGAGGGDTGVDWANAFLTFFQAWPLAPGDIVLIDYRHAEDDGNVRTWTSTATPSNPAFVISVDSDDSDAYRRGAAVFTASTADSSDWTLNIDNVETHGFDWRSPDDLTLAGTTFYMHDGVFGTRRTSGAELTAGANPSQVYLEDIDIAINNGEEFFSYAGNSIAKLSWKGGTFLDTCLRLLLVPDTVKSLFARVEGVDLSLVPSILNISSASIGIGIIEVILVNCKLKSGYLLIETAANRYGPGMRIEAFGCDSTAGAGRSSTITYEMESFFGKALTVGTHYRNSGSVANGVNYSYRLTALANATVEGAQSTAVWFDLHGTFVDAINVNKTFTIYFAHNGVGDGTAGDMETDQIWIDLIGPDDTVVATSQGVYQNSRLNYNVTPTDHDNDAVSSWEDGSPTIAVHQEMSLLLKPQVAGLYKVRIYFAPGDTADTDVYIDGRIYVTDTP